MTSKKIKHYSGILALGLLLLAGTFLGCTQAEQSSPGYLFFFHGFWLEQHTPEDLHSQHGRYQYPEQVAYFRAAGLTVFSEQRSEGTNAAAYAQQVADRVDSLLALGIAPERITIAGASKGGYIAQYVATILQNPDLKFAFVASFRDQDLEAIPGIDWCGDVLSIYETSDSLGVAAVARHRESSCLGTTFKEVRLSTGLGHGFIFQPLTVWQDPIIAFAKGENP